MMPPRHIILWGVLFILWNTDSMGLICYERCTFAAILVVITNMLRAMPNTSLYLPYFRWHSSERQQWRRHAPAVVVLQRMSQVAGLENAREERQPENGAGIIVQNNQPNTKPELQPQA